MITIVSDQVKLMRLFCGGKRDNCEMNMNLPKLFYIRLWFKWSTGSIAHKQWLTILQQSTYTLKGNRLHLQRKNKLGMSKVIGTEKQQLNPFNDTLHPHKLIIVD